MAVVVYHLGATGGWSLLPGGFIGVDVFFVLSGFLVTQLLLRDILGGGRIRLGRFYSRRFRRLRQGGCGRDLRDVGEGSEGQGAQDGARDAGL